ncbi:hypothetical protein ATCC90586_011203 [Pythium insidiosum]|nr:hypothetical protein ATCC90586_011203 [Pythium insidiosum]
MQFEPPTKPTDVAVSINAGSGDDGSSAGTDHNGLVTGRWKTGLFGFTDSLVPNGTHTPDSRLPMPRHVLPSRSRRSPRAWA